MWTLVVLKSQGEHGILMTMLVIQWICFVNFYYRSIIHSNIPHYMQRKFMHDYINIWHVFHCSSVTLLLRHRISFIFSIMKILLCFNALTFLSLSISVHFFITAFFRRRNKKCRKEMKLMSIMNALVYTIAELVIISRAYIQSECLNQSQMAATQTTTTAAIQLNKRINGKWYCVNVLKTKW